MIEIPKEIQDLRSEFEVCFVVNVSGGKDSTATALALVEAGIPHRRVFADTAWEAPETYAHLSMLREKLGRIDVVGYPGGMPAKIREGARFASRMQRWCTRELKIELLRKYCDKIELGGEVVITVTGIRAEEGTKTNGRAEALEFEDDPQWGGFMWRPIHKWTIAEVMAIHHRNGVPVNELYQRGHDRVGCYPCVMAAKDDIRLIAEHAPERIALIRELEHEATAERVRRNAEHRAEAIAKGTYVEPYTVRVPLDPNDPDGPMVEEERGYQPRYRHTDATFFLTVQRQRGGAMGIDDVVAWSKTVHGGRQLPIFPTVPDGGCFRWGLCEAPAGKKEPGQ